MNRHLERGLRLVELKRYTEAAQEFMQSTTVAGNEARGLAFGAGSLAMAGDLKGADELIRQARQLDADDDAVIIMDSSVKLLQDRPREARACMHRLLAKHPLDADLLSLAAILEVACHDLTAGRAYADHGLSLDPCHESCLEAVIYTLSPQSPELPEFTRRLLACSPENATGHLSLATIAHAEDRLDDADRHLAESLRRDPGMNAAHALRGRLAATRHPIYRVLTEGRIGRRRIALGWRIAGLFLPMIIWLCCYAVFFADEKTAHAETSALLRWVSVASMPQTLAVFWVVCILFWHVWHVFAYIIWRHPLRLFLRHEIPDLILPCLLGLVAILAIGFYIATNDATFFGVACLAPLIHGSLTLALTRAAPSARTSAFVAAGMMMSGVIAALIGQLMAFPSSTILWTLVLINMALWCLLTPSPAKDPSSSTPPPLPT
jgi:Tfp pilus assembly protein PilF